MSRVLGRGVASLIAVPPEPHEFEGVESPQPNHLCARPDCRLHYIDPVHHAVKPQQSEILVKEAVVQVGERTLSLGRSTSTYYLVDESDQDVFGRATSTVVPFESLDVRDLVNLIGELCGKVREQEGSIEALRGRIAEMAG